MKKKGAFPHILIVLFLFFALLAPVALFAQTPDTFVPVQGVTIAGIAILPGDFMPMGSTSTVYFQGQTWTNPFGMNSTYDAEAWFGPAPAGAQILPPGWEGIGYKYVCSAPYAGFGIFIARIPGPGYAVYFTYGGCPSSYATYWQIGAHRISAPNPPIFSSPAATVAPAQGNLNPKGGDPVDVSTGLFILDKTDLVLPDVLPITLTRTYRTLDPAPRAFGIGSTHAYDLYLLRNDLCSEVRLILPDGGRIRYLRTSGTNCYDSTLVHTSTPTRFFQSTLVWDATLLRWVVRLKDGTVYRFIAPDLGAVACRPHQCQSPSRHPGR